MANFGHHALALLDPRFSSPLLDVVTDLEHLRRLELRTTTPPTVFLDLKRVFHALESLASARIEGNHTKLADYVEARVGSADHGPGADAMREIQNIEKAMEGIDATSSPGLPLSEHVVQGLHALAVDGLDREGDRTPGAYRLGHVEIAQSEHLPPPAVQVPDYMAELVSFINRADPPKYDLMKVALAHHRFAWIHPFGNGNGRVVRLLTYALLIQYGFRVSADQGRLLNPAAVFCADRDKYCAMLARADSGKAEDLEAWCTYVLTGLRDELRKLDRLASYASLTDEVLLPALAYARERQWVTAIEAAVLGSAIRQGVVKSGDLAPAMPAMNPQQRTYQLKKLLAAGMLQPIRPGARQYTIGFSNNALLHGVVRALDAAGFISGALARG